MGKCVKNDKLFSKWSVKKPLYIDKKDERYGHYVKQIKERGFSDVETWSLYSVIAEFALPRLKRFREITIGYPPQLTLNKWHEIIDEMIFAFEWALLMDEEEYFALDNKTKKKTWKKCEEGMKLFSKYFFHLWW